MAVFRTDDGDSLKRVDEGAGQEPPAWAKGPQPARRSRLGRLLWGGLVMLAATAAVLWAMSPWRPRGAPSPAQAHTGRLTERATPNRASTPAPDASAKPLAALRPGRELENAPANEQPIATPFPPRAPAVAIATEHVVPSPFDLPIPVASSADRRTVSAGLEIEPVSLPEPAPPTLRWSPLGASPTTGSSVDAGSGSPDSTDATPSAPAIVVQRLDFTVTDAEYSTTLNRIVIVSAQPNALHVYDPAEHQDVTLDLARTPTSVSLSPDGRFAAVGHDAKLTGVDLGPPRVAKTFDVTCDVGDTVLSDNGYIYAAPARGGQQHLRAVLIAANTEFQNSGRTIAAGMRFKLHAAGDRLYGIRRTGSPTDLERVNIDSGIPVYGYDSPYHGDYPMGPDLWLSTDGRWIFTAGGSVFRAANDRKSDMTYAGSLKPLVAIEHLTHAPAARRLLAVPAAASRSRISRGDDAPGDNKVFVFDDKNLNLLDTITLPEAMIDGESSPLHGRFVFVDAEGERYYVLAVTEPRAGGDQPWVIASGVLGQP